MIRRLLLEDGLAHRRVFCSKPKPLSGLNQNGNPCYKECEAGMSTEYNQYFTLDSRRAKYVPADVRETWMIDAVYCGNCQATDKV